MGEGGVGWVGWRGAYGVEGGKVRGRRPGGGEVCVCRGEAGGGGGGGGGLPSHSMGTQREGLLNSHQTVGIILRGTITRKLKKRSFFEFCFCNDVIIIDKADIPLRAPSK